MCRWHCRLLDYSGSWMFSLYIMYFTAFFAESLIHASRCNLIIIGRIDSTTREFNLHRASSIGISYKHKRSKGHHAAYGLQDLDPDARLNCDRLDLIAALHEPDLPPGSNGVRREHERVDVAAPPCEADAKPSTQAHILDRAAGPLWRKRREQLNSEDVIQGGLVRGLNERVLHAEITSSRSAKASQRGVRR